MNQAPFRTSADTSPIEPLSPAQTQVLRRAVAKIVLLGAEVGITADHMILLLQSGLTVGELLDYIAARENTSA